jgi:membrane-associated protein
VAEALRAVLDLGWRLLDVLLHLDRHLALVIQDFGGWTYLILFLIIFCETGLVVTPILPGDSLLFAVGALAAREGGLNLALLLLLLPIAAILGDTVNYWIGHYFGPKIFKKEKSRWLNPKHLERTHAFYEKYGGKTIIIARFLPIIRTFAPFVAGIGSMSYSRFMMFNVVGGIGWILFFVLAGYFFGNIPAVKNNFTLVILVIIVVSTLPPIIEFLRVRFRRGPTEA